MTESIPRHTSTADGFRDAKEIAGLRPMAEPKPRAPRKVNSSPMLAVDGKLFCVRCNSEVKDDLDGVRHVNSCLWKALVEIAGSGERARELARGMRDINLEKLPTMMSDFVSWRASLSDEECRDASALANRLRGKGYEVPDEVLQKAREYARRVNAGTIRLLSPGEAAIKRRDALARARLRKLEFSARKRLQIPEPAELRTVRELSGLSRDELGPMIGVTGRAIAYWENGTNLPQRGTLDAYLRILRREARRVPPVEQRAALRKTKGLTQKQLGDLLGVSDVAVSFWERGRYNPETHVMMQRYAVALGWKPTP